MAQPSSRKDRPEQGVSQEAPMTLALREMKAFLSRPSFWMLHGGGMVIAAVAGPFHTMQNLTFPGRLVYWSIVVVFISVLLAVFSISARVINRDRLHWVPVNILASLSATPICLGFVWSMNTFYIGLAPDLPGWQLLGYVGIPIVLINLMVNASTEADRREAARRLAFERQFGARFETLDEVELEPATEPNVVPLPRITPVAAEPPASDPAAVPLLFEKLPEELGRDLICLQAQDHYVEATTVEGQSQVLMRLSDAERDLTGFDGMRVHRSWWVNLDHVTDMARTENGGTELVTDTGLKIPVSRAQRTALRDALDQRRKAAQ